MKRQRGFILYAALGALAVIAVMGVALKVQSSRLDAANDRLDAYKTAGESAKREAERITKLDKERKDKADAENKRRIAVLRADNERLRNSANQSSLPGTGSVAGGADRITFDRGELDAAIRAFTAGTAAIASEGAEAVTELNGARSWAQDSRK